MLGTSSQMLGFIPTAVYNLLPFPSHRFWLKTPARDTFDLKLSLIPPQVALEESA